MSAPTNPFKAVTLCFYKPSQVFNNLKDASGWSWLPFALIATLMALVQFSYFSSIDWSWYQQEYLTPNLLDLSSEDRENIMTMMQPMGIFTASFATSLASLIFIQALIAFYLTRMTRNDEQNLQGFGDWFGLSWWTNLPVLLPMLISLGIIMSQGNQLPAEVLSISSLNRLLLLPIGNQWYNWSESFSLLLPWHIYLYWRGITSWTALTSSQALTIAIIPFALVFGLWGLSISVF